MCFQPTKEETARNDAVKAAAAGRDRWADRPEERRRDPSSYPEPRGNGQSDREEVERSERKLASVLGH